MTGPAADRAPSALPKPAAGGPEPALDSEITWLLHRAAQRMRTATGEQAENRGLQLRDYIVLSALHKTPNLTQVELGASLGLDKTTLMSQLDRLERAGYVVRRLNPQDRRARIPDITTRGEAIRREVATASEHVEQDALGGFSSVEVALLRRMLIEVIGRSQDPGSCL